MKNILFLLLSLTTFVSAQESCQVKEYYGDFIFIKKYTNKKKQYVSKGISSFDKKTCFSELVNNKHYISYLLTQFSSDENDSILLGIEDSLALQKQFIKFISADTMFNQVMGELIAKAIDRSMPKDTVTMDNLLNIAVKFFSILSISDQGTYRGLVCSGRNDIAKTEKVRQPQIEAFCFSSVSKYVSDPELNLYNEFVKAMKEIHKLNLGVDQNERLLRAQGAIFVLMKNNEKLKQVLSLEYQQNKNILPFVLQGF